MERGAERRREERREMEIPRGGISGNSSREGGRLLSTWKIFKRKGGKISGNSSRGERRGREKRRGEEIRGGK